MSPRWRRDGKPSARSARARVVRATPASTERKEACTSAAGRENERAQRASEGFTRPTGKLREPQQFCTTVAGRHHRWANAFTGKQLASPLGQRQE